MPGETLAPFLDVDANGERTVTSVQTGEEGEVGAVCISFGPFD